MTNATHQQPDHRPAQRMLSSVSDVLASQSALQRLSLGGPPSGGDAAPPRTTDRPGHGAATPSVAALALHPQQLYMFAEHQGTMYLFSSSSSGSLGALGQACSSSSGGGAHAPNSAGMLATLGFGPAPPQGAAADGLLLQPVRVVQPAPLQFLLQQDDLRPAPWALTAPSIASADLPALMPGFGGTGSQGAGSGSCLVACLADLLAGSAPTAAAPGGEVWAAPLTSGPTPQPGPDGGGAAMSISVDGLLSARTGGTGGAGARSAAPAMTGSDSCSGSRAVTHAAVAAGLAAGMGTAAGEGQAPRPPQPTPELGQQRFPTPPPTPVSPPPHVPAPTAQDPAHAATTATIATAPGGQKKRKASPLQDPTSAAPRAAPSLLTSGDLILPSVNRRIVGRNFYLGRPFMTAVFGAGFRCPLRCPMQMQINGVVEERVYDGEWVAGSTSWYPRGLPLSRLRGREMCGARWQEVVGGDEAGGQPGRILVMVFKDVVPSSDEGPPATEQPLLQANESGDASHVPQ